MRFTLLILIHKWNEAFQMGYSLFKGGIPLTKARVYIVIYSLLTPIGVAIGVILRDISHDNYKVMGILMAIPVGIFIYIAIIEVILEEFLVADHKFIKFLFLLFGIFFVYFQTYLEQFVHN